MKVRILVTAKYAEFRTGRYGAELLEAGTEIDWPPHYAEDCISSGLVELAIDSRPEPEEVKLNITAAALRLARELDVTPWHIVGTGQHGRITVADVRQAVGG